MDSQLKKGLLEICVLAALAKQDSYGYQIIKDVSQVIEISESTLYPILKRQPRSGNLFRRAQQPAAEVLPADGQRPPAHRRFSGRLEISDGRDRFY